MIKIVKITLLESRKITTERWKAGHETTEVEDHGKWRIKVVFPDPLIEEEAITKTIVVYVKNGQPTNLEIYWQLSDRYSKLIGPYWNTVNVQSDTDGKILKDEKLLASRREMTFERNEKVRAIAKKVEKAITTRIKRLK